MSLIAAAVGATIVGVAGSSLVVEYEQKDYELRISELQGLISKLEAHEARLEELKGQISNFWDDPAALRTSENLQDELEKVREYTVWASDMARNFQNVVDQMGSGLDVIMDTVETIGKTIDSIVT